MVLSVPCLLPLSCVILTFETKWQISMPKFHPTVITLTALTPALPIDLLFTSSSSFHHGLCISLHGSLGTLNHVASVVQKKMCVMLEWFGQQLGLLHVSNSSGYVNGKGNV